MRKTTAFPSKVLTSGTMALTTPTMSGGTSSSDLHLFSSPGCSEAVGIARAGSSSSPTMSLEARPVPALQPSKFCPVHTKTDIRSLKLLQQHVHLPSKLLLVVREVWPLVCEQMTSGPHDVTAPDESCPATFQQECALKWTQCFWGIVCSSYCVVYGQ